MTYGIVLSGDVGLYHSGTLYVTMGRLDDGEKQLKHALKLNPHHHGAMNNLRVVEHHRKTQRKQR